jgi:hypothetical protein
VLNKIRNFFEEKTETAQTALEGMGEHLKEAADELLGKADEARANQDPPEETTIEKLSAEEYPQLYQKTQDLKQRINEVYRDDALPDVYIVEYSQSDLDKMVEQEKPPYEGFYFDASIAEGFNLPFVADGEKEAVVISSTIIRDFGVDTALEVIAHEYGHDTLNHLSTRGNKAKDRSEECEADHFAAKFGSGGAGIQEFFAYLSENYENAGTSFLFGSTHPEHENRENALRNKEALEKAVGDAHFDDQCSLLDAPFDPEKDASSPFDGLFNIPLPDTPHSPNQDSARQRA